MSKVSITRSLLDDLAMSISAKSGEAVPMTLTEMKDAVDSIQTGGGATLITKSITANGTYNASSDSADGYSSVTVNVSGGTPRTSTDLVVSGATVTAPAGVYATDASKSVATGTAGTPTASKGSVSNHSISVTPSVTNTSGYITGSTKTGTAVTVSASELVSGNLPITQNGNNIDCANYSTVSVNVSGSSKNAQVVQSTTRTGASTLTAIGAELTVSKTGTYDIYYSCFRTNTSSSYTWATRLYINGTAYGTAENATWTNNQQNTHLSNISLTANDKLRVYGRNTRGTSYYVCAPMLVIIEA